MNIKKTTTLGLGLALALSTAACGGNHGDAGGGRNRHRIEPEHVRKGAAQRAAERVDHQTDDERAAQAEFGDQQRAGHRGSGEQHAERNREQERGEADLERDPRGLAELPEHREIERARRSRHARAEICVALAVVPQVVLAQDLLELAKEENIEVSDKLPKPAIVAQLRAGRAAKAPPQ